MLIAGLVAATVVLVLISLLFFLRGSALPLLQRLSGSVHALLIAVIVPYGLAVDALTTGEPAPAYQLPILGCALLGLASMVYSFWAFRGQPLLYLAHLFTIAAALPAIVLAAVAIVGWT